MRSSRRVWLIEHRQQPISSISSIPFFIIPYSFYRDSLSVSFFLTERGVFHLLYWKN